MGKASFMDERSRGGEEVEEVAMDDDAMMESASEEARPMMMMAAATSTVTEGAMMGASFTIDRRAVIPSDGMQHKVVVGTVATRPKFEHVAVPRAAPSAFLTVTAANNSPYHLLPGPMQVFLDGSAMTSTSLPLVAPQENFTVSFGVDEAVRVKQIATPKLDQDKGLFFGETKKRTVTHVMNIKNTKRVAVVLEVRDKIPQSAQKDVVVKLEENTLKASAPGGELSFAQATPSSATWRLKLPAGAEQTLTLKYSVEWPKDKEVTGL